MSSEDSYELYCDSGNVSMACCREISELAKVVNSDPEKVFLVIDQSGAMIEMQKADRMDGLPLFLYDLSKQNQLLQRDICILKQEIQFLKNINSQK